MLSSGLLHSYLQNFIICGVIGFSLDGCFPLSELGRVRKDVRFNVWVGQTSSFGSCEAFGLNYADEECIVPVPKSQLDAAGYAVVRLPSVSTVYTREAAEAVPASAILYGSLRGLGMQLS